MTLYSVPGVTLSSSPNFAQYETTHFNINYKNPKLSLHFSHMDLNWHSKYVYPCHRNHTVCSTVYSLMLGLEEHHYSDDFLYFLQETRLVFTFGLTWLFWGSESRATTQTTQLEIEINQPMLYCLYTGTIQIIKLEFTKLLITWAINSHKRFSHTEYLTHFWYPFCFQPS